MNWNLDLNYNYTKHIEMLKNNKNLNKNYKINFKKEL